MAELCVTGGTGFIGAYLVKALLEKGYLVRTTVRDPGQLLLLFSPMTASVNLKSSNHGLLDLSPLQRSGSILSIKIKNLVPSNNAKEAIKSGSILSIRIATLNLI